MHLSVVSLVVLLGYHECSPSKIFSKTRLSLFDMQTEWIKWATRNHPKFPQIHTLSKNGKVDARHAMFALNGTQMKAAKMSFKKAAGFYNFVPIESLGGLFYNELQGLIFKRHGFSEEFKIRTHQFRHLHNDTGEKLGIPHAILNLWSGRKSPEQLLHYIYRTDGERAGEISDILFNTDKISEDEAVQSIRLVSMDKYKETIHDVASATSTGVCVQSLNITPCTYFNDFETQCTLCSASCHVAHDRSAICLIERDLKHQKKRLSKVLNNEKFKFSQAMHKWFKTHFKNTEVLQQLVDLMKDPEIKEGSFIRLVGKHQEFRITDLDSQIVERKGLKLSDVEGELTKALATTKKLGKACKQDNTINDLLEMI